MNIAVLKVMLQRCLDDIVGTIAGDMRAKGRVASGRTIRETTTDITETAEGLSGKVLVPSWFQFVESGSGPGRRGTWFYRIIHQWAKDKHIIGDDTPKSRRISGAIAHSIITDGTKAYRIGGEDVFNTDVERIVDKYSEVFAGELVKEIEKTF